MKTYKDEKQVHVQNVRNLYLSTDFSGTMDTACKELESKPKWESDVAQHINFMPFPSILLQNLDTHQFVIGQLVGTHSLTGGMFFVFDHVSIP